MELLPGILILQVLFFLIINHYFFKFLLKKELLLINLTVDQITPIPKKTQKVFYSVQCVPTNDSFFYYF